LLLPILARLTHLPMARWCAWVASPLEPFAPALAAHGIELSRVLVVRPAGVDSRANRWAFEQAVGSGACDVVMGWAVRPRPKDIRRLQLAAERGHALGVLFRPLQAARESSHAVLRLALKPCEKGLRATLLKSRGGSRGTFEIDLHSGS
jgi:cell division inhibitor SulA